MREGDQIDIEKKAVKAKVEIGLSPEEELRSRFN